ncbi:protein oca4 [Anaeramoeba ignava]|uniref:Protein oca4 n=1 Tax=Anaeramoeba ignava TaxID=1746090 RepID=A0A9Q0LJE9_ANAIG|nr:protein oca4 [Anaeramoeba ignava]
MHAVYYGTQFGPIFGGNDIYIYGNLKGGHTDFGFSYALPHGIEYSSQDALEFFAGSYKMWKIEELEFFIFFSKIKMITEIPLLTPPDKFGIVEPGIFRSNTIHDINFSFLQTLKLKTVIQLSPELPTKSLLVFYEENGINFIHLGFRKWNVEITWKPMSEEIIKEALEIVLNVEKHPILITCTSGIHQTGVLVGCLRKLQKWNLNSILLENIFYGLGTVRLQSEQLIESYDTDLVDLPSNLPEWFQFQRKLMMEEDEELRKL